MYGMRKQTETTVDLTDQAEGALEIITDKANRVLRSNKSQGVVYDGLAFRPSVAQGVSSDIVYFTEDAEVFYTCGNFYCLWEENQRRDFVVQRNSQHGQLQLLYSIRTSKMNLLGSAEHVNGCVSRLNIYDREARRHRQLNIVSTGKALGMHIINPGQLGMILFDEGHSHDRPMFSVCLFDTEKETSCASQERSTQALKLVASNFGDFTMVLCKDTCYQLEIDMYNKKMDLSEFDLKRFIDPGEECIDACFLKDTIKLVVVTNRRRLFLFDGRLLVSKREIMVPVENIVPFETSQGKQAEVPTESESPLRKPGIKYRRLVTPKSIDSSAEEVVVLFEDMLIVKLKLENGKYFKHQCSFELPGEPYKQTQVRLTRLINGDVYVVLNRKMQEAWRMSVSSKQGQQNYQLCPRLSAMPYMQMPGLHLWDTCTVFKTLYTLHRDRILRVWHVEQGLKFSKPLFESPLSMSVHPLGFQLCISFKQFTRLFLLKQDILDIIFTLKIRNISSVKYSPEGDQLLILDSPTLTIINPYNYETLMSFSVTLTNITDMQCYRSNYVVRNENYLWMFDNEGNKLVEKKVLLYDLCSKNSILYCDGRKLRLYEPTDQTYHNDWEMDLAHVLDEHEKVTTVKVIQYYGIVLLGTSDGNMVEMLWPIPEEPSTYKYKASNSAIIGIRIAESYRQAICLTSSSEIILLDIVQYIEGGQTPGVYVFASAKRQEHQDSELDLQPNVYRRTILNREYLLDGYGFTGHRILQERATQTEQQSANLAQIRGQMQEQRHKNTNQVTAILDNKKSSYMSKVSTEDQAIKQLKEEHSSRMESLKEKLRITHEQYQHGKQTHREKFDAELLQIIKRSHQLTATIKKQQERLSNIMSDLHIRNEEITKALRQDRGEKFETLMQKYGKLMEAVDEDRRKMASIQFEQDLQQKLYRERIQAQLNNQLQKATTDNDQLSSSITQHRKEIERFKKRAKLVSNEIEQRQQQIKVLEQARQNYRKIIAGNAEDLKTKEQVINQKQSQIKRLLMENKHVKSFKEIHEYLMQEYTNETIPNEIREEQLEEKVRRMNQQLLQEIQWRRNAENELEEATKYMGQLKQQQAAKQNLRHHLQTNVDSFAFELKSMLKNSPVERWNDTLREVFDRRFSGKSVAELLTQALMGEQSLQFSQEQILIQKKIDDLMREKDELSKRQVKEETIAHFQQKYKEELFRKYHGENTELVKEFNLLTKEQKLLAEQVTTQLIQLGLLKERHAYLVAELQSENAMIRSLSVTQHRQTGELKPTPFQRYQQELTIQKRKLPSAEKISTQPTTSRQESSSTWLKGLMKDIENSKSKLETAEIVRAKVKSFVNPELSRLPTTRKLESPSPLPAVIDVFNKLSLQNRQVRTKSELIKSVLRRGAEAPPQ